MDPICHMEIHIVFLGCFSIVFQIGFSNSSESSVESFQWHIIKSKCLLWPLRPCVIWPLLTPPNSARNTLPFYRPHISFSRFISVPWSSALVRIFAWLCLCLSSLRSDATFSERYFLKFYSATFNFTLWWVFASWHLEWFCLCVFCFISLCFSTGELAGL